MSVRLLSPHGVRTQSAGASAVSASQPFQSGEQATACLDRGEGVFLLKSPAGVNLEGSSAPGVVAGWKIWAMAHRYPFTETETRLDLLPQPMGTEFICAGVLIAQTGPYSGIISGEVEIDGDRYQVRHSRYCHGNRVQVVVLASRSLPKAKSFRKKSPLPAGA
jgi:hypothetical protein